ncbi:MAG TPA: chemotaxis protein CheW [Blastocatellia bacterium]|nr:chemotaxis protein CheW [Blastocatellia bacterium]
MAAKKDKGTKSSLMDALTAISLGLVRPDDDSKADGDLESVLVFEIDGQLYSIAVENTEGVVHCPRISPLPSPPDGIVGVASVRGRITVVVDLSMKSNPKPSKQRLILLKGEAQLGLLADRLEGVVGLAPKQMKKSPARKKGEPAEVAKLDWPVRSFFKHAGRDVPVIDTVQLNEI